MSRDRPPSIRELNVGEIGTAKSDNTELAAGDDSSRIAWALAGVVHPKQKQKRQTNKAHCHEGPQPSAMVTRGYYRMTAEPTSPT